MSLYTAKPEHEVAYQDLIKLVAKQGDKYNLTPLELLAVAANMLGKLVAMQDQRSITVAGAMEIVARNIEVGNRAVIDHLADGPGAGRA